MEPTIQSLDNTIKSINNTVKGLSLRIGEMEKKLVIYVTKSEMQSFNSSLTQDLGDTNTSLSNLETKLQKVVLPDDTRYYLKESEITDFRNHFRQLRSMMSELEKSRQSFIRLASRYNLTNSQI